jgi:plastocyanin domain-containing protein
MLLGNLLGLAILLSSPTAIARASPAATTTVGQYSMPHAAEKIISGQTSQFRPIAQPLALKIGVVAGGLMLIGLELWWFLYNSKKP